MAPFGLRKMLNWIKEHYGDWEIIITENGVSDNGEIDDQPRIQYYKVRSISLNQKLKIKYFNQTNAKPQNDFWIYTDTFGPGCKQRGVFQFQHILRVFVFLGSYGLEKKNNCFGLLITIILKYEYLQIFCRNIQISILLISTYFYTVFGGTILTCFLQTGMASNV